MKICGDRPLNFFARPAIMSVQRVAFLRKSGCRSAARLFHSSANRVAEMRKSGFEGLAHFLFLGKKGKLQAIVAIKCLDEGVNIPGIRTAFILASTTNPKEYIQRRGRVLRKAPGKEFAEIYDFVTLPRPLDSVSAMTEDQAKRDMALVRNELARIKEFGRLSMNPMDTESLIWEIQDAYHITSDEPDDEEF